MSRDLPPIDLALPMAHPVHAGATSVSRLGSPISGLTPHPYHLASMQSSSVLHAWYRHRLCSKDRVERHYAFLIGLLVAASVLFAMIKNEGPIWEWGAPVCSLWALALLSVTLTNVWAEQRDRSGVFELTRLAQFLLTMLAVLVYYGGSNIVNRWRFKARGSAMLYDSTLLKMDEFLLGWLYPRGQMALYLDTQYEFGVTTQIGRVYAEVLQILYISYYFWGNAIGVWLAFQYFWYAVWKKNKGTKKRLQWRRIQMFVSAWVGTFVLNHLVNLCFPAMSPRIFIADAFQNELKGVWLLGGLRNAVTQAAAQTYSAFPSGHCGLSILAALLSFRIGLPRAYSYLVLLTSVLIVLATQVLRYHYFVDFLFSLPLVAFGAWLGGFHDAQLYQTSLTQMGEEEHDEDGKPVASPSAQGAYENSETAPLIGGAGATGGLTSSASRQKLSTVDDHHSPDIELGRIDPPLVLSSQVFGMTRSASAQHMNSQLAKVEENASEKAV